MRGKYEGIIPVEELFQALWQDREFFEGHGITHLRAVFLYFTPCDERGEQVVIKRHGRPVEGYVSAGCYRSAAANYDNVQRLTPAPLLGQPE